MLDLDLHYVDLIFHVEGETGLFRRTVTANGALEWYVRTDLKAGGKYKLVCNAEIDVTKDELEHEFQSNFS